MAFDFFKLFADNTFTRTQVDKLRRLYEYVVENFWGADYTGDAFRADFTSAAGVRKYFQSSVANGVTNVSVVPNGTGPTAIVSVFGSSNWGNASTLQMGATGTAVFFNADFTGTGTQPTQIGFRFDGVEKLAISPNRTFADFNNASHALRHLFQTSTTNANTVIGALPNGTGTVSAVNLYTASDPENAGIVQLRADPTQCILGVTKTGTGTTPPKMAFQFDNVEKLSLDNIGTLRADYSSWPGRAYFQTNVANLHTAIDAVPNGTSQIALFSAFGSSDRTNAPFVNFGMFNGVPVIDVTKVGTATAATKLSFQFLGVEKAYLNNSGSLETQSGVVSRSNGVTAKLGADGANGFLAMVPGSAAFPGYVALHAADGTRRGYMGWGDGGSNLLLHAEGGWGWQLLGANFLAQCAIRSTGSSAILYAYDRTTGRNWGWYGQSDIFRLFNGGSDVMQIDASGNTYALNFIASSDITLKDLERPATWRLDLFDALEQWWFRWKIDGRRGRSPIAQQVAKMAPDRVHVRPDGKLGVDYGLLGLDVGMTANARARALEAEVADLRRRLERLEQR